MDLKKTLKLEQKGRIFNLVSIALMAFYLIVFLNHLLVNKLVNIYGSYLIIALILSFPLLYFLFAFIGYKKGGKELGKILIIIGILAFVFVFSASYFSCCIHYPPGYINHNEVYTKGCLIAKARNCTQVDFNPETALVIETYDIDGNEKNESIITACKNIFGSQITPEGCRLNCCGS